MSSYYEWGTSSPVLEAGGWEGDRGHEGGLAVLGGELDVAAEFAQLSEQWQAATADISSITKRIAHPLYQRIIGLGRPVLPVLLDEFAHRPNYWFHALRSITGQDPVPEQGPWQSGCDGVRLDQVGARYGLGIELANPVDLDNFPDLADLGYKVTSDVDWYYNCVVWAAGDTENWWWPDEDGYWPQPKPDEISVDTLVAAFVDLGYVECGSSDHEPGFEKIAIYGVAEDNPTHAAKQIGPDVWSSKLGSSEDISHGIDGLNGPVYGQPLRFLRRPLVP